MQKSVIQPFEAPQGKAPWETKQYFAFLKSKSRQHKASGNPKKAK